MKALDAAESVEDVAKALTQAKAAINAVKTDSNMAKEERAAQARITTVAVSSKTISAKTLKDAIAKAGGSPIIHRMLHNTFLKRERW